MSARSHTHVVVVLFVSALLLIPPLYAEAYPPSPQEVIPGAYSSEFLGFAPASGALSLAYDQQATGLKYAVAGRGVKGDSVWTSGASRSISIQIPGVVQRAYLYWQGRLRKGNPTVEEYRDRTLVFEGQSITGGIAGSETESNVFNVAYYYDVTQIVSAKGTGNQSFSVRDPDTSSNLNIENVGHALDGIGLLVVYVDSADTTRRRVMVYHGADMGYGSSTSPVTMAHGASSSARAAKLSLFVGDCESGDSVSSQ